ncbi:MAG: flagellar hook-basal body complex protein [Lachnospiraceae bacterium]|nr:flagellar hook-basal body complex protein [Lachnospiraceae bacterium]
MKNADGTPMTTSNMNPLPASMEEPMKTQMDKYYDVGKTGITPKNQPMYTITLTDILDSDNQSIGIDRLNAADPLGGVTFGESHVWNRNLVSGKVASDITNAAVDDYSTDPATSIPANAFASATDSATARSLQELKSSATIVNDGGKTVSGPLAGVGGEFFGMSDAEIDSYGKDATYYFSGGKLYISSENKTSIVTFDPDTGAITGGSNMTMKFTNDPPRGLESFKNIEVDATTLTNINTNGSSTFKATKGDTDGNNTGRMVGTMNGISVEVTGKIWASYSNGQTKLLGQIATAEFANASGLEKGGDNLYRQTNNSGDATIQEIEASGGKMNTGVLEMSNVDLSSEFTTMITTQRGFQANSRIITVSDTLLEELTNLKR